MEKIRALGPGVFPHPVILISKEMPLIEALRMMQQKSIHHLIVSEHATGMIGMLSDRDIIEHGFDFNSGHFKTHATIKDIFHPVVKPVHQSLTVQQTLSLFREQAVQALPVVANGSVIGIITESDLLQIFAKMLEDEEEGWEAAGRGQVLMSHPLVLNAVRLLDSVGI